MTHIKIPKEVEKIVSELPFTEREKVIEKYIRCVEDFEFRGIPTLKCVEKIQDDMRERQKYKLSRDNPYLGCLIEEKIRECVQTSKYYDIRQSEEKLYHLCRERILNRYHP